jgi:hypothetical protein
MDGETHSCYQTPVCLESTGTVASYLTLRESALEAFGKNPQQAGVTCRI